MRTVGIKFIPPKLMFGLTLPLPCRDVVASHFERMKERPLVRKVM